MFKAPLNAYSITQGVNSIFVLGTIAILLVKGIRKPIHQTFLWWSIFLFLWTSTWFMWTIQDEKDAAILWLKILMYAVCMIHVAYFHFNLAFCESTHRYKGQLILAYLSGAVSLLINYFNGFMDLSNIRPKGPMPYWPHGTPLLWLLIAIEIYFVSLSFYIVFNSAKAKKVDAESSRLKIFLIASVIAWIGGMTNWIPFFDAIPILPVGNICVSFYLGIAMYLIFKHDLLQLNLAIRRTFIYGFMTLFITLVYILFIVLFEKLFQSYFGYSSLIGTALASLIIAGMFNPFRNVLTRFLDRKFFGKSIADLSVENDQMKAELEKQDQMKAVATLAAGMAHEIKNPLTSIKTFAEYLPEKYEDAEFRDRFKRIVVDEVDRVNNIVKQLLEFAKPREPELSRVSINTVLDETIELLNSNLLSHSIRVVKNYTQDQKISADKSQLKQAFLNLFLNSIQAMPDGGTLTICTSLTTDYRLLTTISDTGEGIPAADLKRVFDPFFTTREDGTGLGLSIVHGIITQHAGKLEIKSRLKEGTTVSVILKS